MKTLNTGISTINGVNVIDPSDVEVTRNTIQDPEAGRDMNGTMHMLIIAVKRTYTLTWKVITPEDAQTIINAVESDTFFPVRFMDIKRNEMVTGTFYSGDRTYGVQQWIPNRKDGKLYKDFKVKLIEQ